MLRKALCLIHPLRYETNEMRTSYAQFQIENEKNLLSVYNIMFTPAVLTFLLFAVLGQFSLEVLITRSTIVFATVFAYFLRDKSSALQKLILLLATGSSILLFTFRLETVTEGHIQGAFVIGNAIGLNEMSLLLLLKDTGLRSFIYLIFTSIKIFALREELSVSPCHCIMFIGYVLFALVFFLFNNMLEVRIFKNVYESRDKLKKFQELLSNDLPSSVIIISSNLTEILYSNQFFRSRSLSQGMSSNQHCNDVNIFSNFMIKQTNDNRSTEICLIDFLKKLESDSKLNENRVLEFDAHYRNQTESDVHYHIKLRQITWDGKKSYAMVLHDVSDKEVLAVLKLADEQKDRVIATVSHELRTPINGIMGLLEMIKIRINDTISLEYLDHAKSCSKLLLYLVNSILDLSQIRHNQNLQISKCSFDFVKFLEELKSLYIFHAQQKGIKFLINVDPLVPRNIFTDKYRLIEILINLLGNSMKFTFKGSITLDISVDQSDSKKLQFCVEDTGIGIQETDKPKLFQMFGKIDQADHTINSQGVGLGLTIANELVRLLNNQYGSEDERIQFESEYGKGSKFWFRIDATSDCHPFSFLSDVSIDSNKDFDFADKGLQELGPQSINEVGKKVTLHSLQNDIPKSFTKLSTGNMENEQNSNRRLLSNERESLKPVLIVDDSPFNLMAAAFILDQLGFKARKAYNGKEALEMLEKSTKNEEKYCLILTDIQMPVLDGLEMSKVIAEKIKKGEMYDVPIVAVTAKKLSKQETTKYEECGIQFTLEKPLILNEMKKVIDKLLLQES